MTDTRITYREIAPPPQLASLVLSFWGFQVEQVDGVYQHHVPPDGCVSLVVQYGDGGGAPMLLLVGPRFNTFVVPISGRDRYFGVRFWPQAAKVVLRDQLEASIDFVGLLGMRNAELASTLAKQLPNEPSTDAVLSAFEESLMPMIESEAVDGLTSSAVSLIVDSHGKKTVASLAEELDVSQRQLQRCFRAETGLTPKQFSRIRRFRTAAAELLADDPRPWVSVANERGYADQSHMSRDFSQIIGLTAEELREKHEHIFHQDVNP